MSTINHSDMILPPELQADTEAILAFLGGQPLDPTVAARIRARGDRIRERILCEHGIQDIGVPAIRELRDE